MLTKICCVPPSEKKKNNGLPPIKYQGKTVASYVLISPSVGTIQRTQSLSLSQRLHSLNDLARELIIR
jgi:hypothetical protein